MRRTEKVLRTTGRAIISLGLVGFYGSWPASAIDAPTDALLRGGAIAAALGCYWLIGVLLWPPGRKGKVTIEATLGFLCLPAAFVSMFAASGDEIGLQVSWLIITVFFVCGAIGLIAQATRVKQGGERWRNRDAGGG